MVAPLMVAPLSATGKKGQHRAMTATVPIPGDAGSTLRFRTIWISDVHLGTRGCKAEYLIDFLDRTDSESLYLVGDIIDGWRLKKTWYWPATHNQVVQRVLRKAQAGTTVVFVPGNHDEFLRDYAGLTFGDIPVVMEAYHETADGRRLWIIHGDAFDGVVRYAKWLAFLGDACYNVAVGLNNWLNFARRQLGLHYWSLSAYLKSKVKNAVAFVDDFERTVAEQARKRDVAGVICGHIHKAEIRDVDGILYCNDGDWVESCTALVEHPDGHLEILRWAEISDLASRSGRRQTLGEADAAAEPAVDTPHAARSV